MSLAQSVVFFGRITTAGAFTTPTQPAPNPVNNVANSCTPARSGAGAYTLTFGSGYPQGEYHWEFGVEGGAANANINATINAGGTVATISTAVAAVATDEAFWCKITQVN